MTIKRLLVTQVFLLAGLGSVTLLPKVADSTPQGITLSLPAYVGDWYGEDQKISEMEMLQLAKDTQFARKLYTDGRGNQIFASIVLSGQDLDNSIHRPERCLPAQGWSVADSHIVQIPLPSPSPLRSLPTTRLHNVRRVPLPDGSTLPIFSLNYYWFIGANEITASHMRRTYLDIRDRIVYGYNQRWAYITIASTITDNVTRFGKNEQETDGMIHDFILHLLPLVKTDFGVKATQNTPARSAMRVETRQEDVMDPLG